MNTIKPVDDFKDWGIRDQIHFIDALLNAPKFTREAMMKLMAIEMDKYKALDRAKAAHVVKVLSGNAYTFRHSPDYVLGAIMVAKQELIDDKAYNFDKPPYPLAVGVNYPPSHKIEDLVRLANLAYILGGWIDDQGNPIPEEP